jgi:hypothetical protein
VEEVGDKIIQNATNSVAKFKAIGELLMQKRKWLSWIDFILKNLRRFSSINKKFSKSRK